MRLSVSLCISSLYSDLSRPCLWTDTPDSKLPACYCFYKYSARASAVLPGSLKESLSNKHVVLIYWGESKLFNKTAKRLKLPCYG